MRRLSTFLAMLLATTLALGGCGGGGGGGADPGPGPGGGPPGGGPPGGGPPGGGDPVVLDPDRDRDGIPNDEDRFPDDPTRFAHYVSHFLEWLSGGRSAAALGVNDAGDVVGFSDDADGFVKAVRWTVASGAPALLRPLAGHDHSAAYGVGEDGAAAGESQKNGSSVAVVWPAGAGDPVELPLGALGPPAAAYGLREGWIAGEATQGGTTHGVLWSGTAAAPIVLPSLGGERTAAHFVGPGGLVVGESEDAAGHGRGVVWILGADGPAGPPLALEPLPGHARSIALSVSANGLVVGESEPAKGGTRAVAWAPTAEGYGPPQDLGAGSAAAVNDRERVAGHRGAPPVPVTWDPRSAELADPFLGAGLSGHAFGIDALDRIVGVAAGGAFVAVPE